MKGRLLVIPSATKLMTFETCKAKYNFQYNLNKPIKTSPQMLRGSLIHKWIAEAIDKKALPNYTVADFDGDKQEAVKELLEKFSGKGWKVGSELEWGLMKDLATFCEYESQQTALQGIIDVVAINQVQKVVLLLDWKSGKSVVNNFQINIYSYVTRLLWPDFFLSAWYFYIDRKRGDRERPVALLSMQEIKEDLEKRLVAISSESSWQGCSDWHCRFCDYASECKYAGKEIISNIEAIKGVITDRKENQL